MSGLLPIDALIPSGLRAALRAEVAAHPHASASADEIADLAVLAVTEALAAIDRVAGRASCHGSAVTILSAASSTTVAVLQRFDAALKAYAADQADGGVRMTIKLRMDQ